MEKTSQARAHPGLPAENEGSPGAKERAPAGRASRRRIVKGAAATAGGLAGAAYVKPSIQSIGVPAALASVSGPQPPPPPPPPPKALQGCTPGYWKQTQHFDSWRGYAPANRFNAVFGVSRAGNPTLLEALEAGGGGEKALGRHAVAALLNSVGSSGVNYAFTTQQVIALVQSAYATSSFETIKNQLERENERGCPLN